jgi:hypothetical protein
MAEMRNGDIRSRYAVCNESCRFDWVRGSSLAEMVRGGNGPEFRLAALRSELPVTNPIDCQNSKAQGFLLFMMVPPDWQLWPLPSKRFTTDNQVCQDGMQDCIATTIPKCRLGSIGRKARSGKYLVSGSSTSNVTPARTYASCCS